MDERKTPPTEHLVRDVCPIEPRPRNQDRYVALGTTEEEVVIFDRTLDSAWVKSDSAIDLYTMV